MFQISCLEHGGSGEWNPGGEEREEEEGQQQGLQPGRQREEDQAEQGEERPGQQEAVKLRLTQNVMTGECFFQPRLELQL